MAWKKYMEFRRKSANAEITDISFRSKELGWKNYSMKIDFSNGNKYSSTVSEDMYLRSFIMDMDLRPSCYDCHFKTIHHLSDFTVRIIGVQINKFQSGMIIKGYHWC